MRNWRYYMKHVTRNLRAIFALVLSSILLAASMLMVGTQGKKAYADESEGPYEKLYYITDNYFGEEYVNNVLVPSLEEVGLGEDSIVYRYIAWDDYFLLFYALWRNEFFSQIKNSYVIFEMQHALPKFNNNTIINFLEILNDIFGMLKEQNCKIMVIFGTEERALALSPLYTEFLTHADIAINTEVKYIFMDNYIAWVQEIYGVSAFDANVMLGPSFCYELGQLIPDSWLFTDYLVPYYLENINPSAQGMKYEDIFYQYFILHNHYIGWADYWDYPEFSYSNTLEHFSDLEYPVGFARTDSSNYTKWEKIMYRMRVNEWEFPIFVLNQNGAKVAQWIENGSKYNNIFYSGDIAAILEYYIPLITHDFIVGEDLTQYDNWPGACDITFKPILPGDDGWMQYSPEVIYSWQIIQEEW